MRMLTVALAIGTLVVPAAAQEPITLTPAQIGSIFCLSRLGNDEGPIAGLLTPDLRATIDGALARDAEWAKANPGEKPPLGDGIPWQTWPDYAAICTAGASVYMMDEATVAIDYGFPDTPRANFTDTLKLRLVDSPSGFGKVWRIDDVAYSEDGTLRQTLASAFLMN